MTATRRVLIGLPAYNEEIALPRLLARIESRRQTLPQPMTVVLYNDGSTDATLATAHAWQQRLPLVVLDGIINKGLGAGLSALVEYAAANGADDDVLVIMDCDDTHDPAQVEAMLARMAEGADVVIGSRYAGGAVVQGVPLPRRIAAVGAAVLFKTIHPVRGVWDYTCGYRAYRVSVLKKAAARYGDTLVTERGFACMVELLLKLNALGARFAEIPLQLHYDQKPSATKMDVNSNIRRLLSLSAHWWLNGFDGS